MASLNELIRDLVGQDVEISLPAGRYAVVYGTLKRDPRGRYEISVPPKGCIIFDTNDVHDIENHTIWLRPIKWELQTSP